MARELLDPGSKFLKDKVRYTFRVVGEPEKLPAGKTTKRVWILQPMGEGMDDMQPVKYGVLPFQAEGIIVVTGGTVTPEGKFDWDPALVDGKVFSADVNYVEQDASNPKNVNPKTGKAYRNMVLSNFETEIPF